MQFIPLDEDDDFDKDEESWQEITNNISKETIEEGLASNHTDGTKIGDSFHQPPLNVTTHHEMDFEMLQTYIYPTNYEIRDYQFNIVKKAFFDNLLVALPTGLGKTFIASTVMLNFLRWFPTSKVIFMAPTRPLVAQQIKACCSITGLSSTKVAILLDKSRKNRKDIWDTRQVFFTTPQVVENDLCSGILNPKSIVLLVIDEAHRSKGNYAYNNVVQFIKRFNDTFRILALTATPAADVEGVQQIIDNLQISKVEVRTENSIDIIKYMKRKKVVRRTISTSDAIMECTELLAQAISPVLKLANQKGAIDIQDPTKINHFRCIEKLRKLQADRSIPEGLKWSMHFMLQLLATVGQCYKKLNNYGIRSFFDYFREKYMEFKTKFEKKKSKNKLNAEFYFSDPIKQLLEKVPELLNSNDFTHPKIECLMSEIDDFFNECTIDDSKVIIFTEFRDSALEIVQCIERAHDNKKPHIFIGQAKEKEKFDKEYSDKEMNVGTRKKQNKGKSRKTSSEHAQQNGMSQKLQKEVIKDFKTGKFNILVATSIGEEGLDIGEVDLIVCFDSTASPIKNIQRMGRTGRKRDGKVVLLFSSNEESKFDKAMAGYEYIQQHIMKGDLINLHQQVRIIPKEFTPVVVEKFIEIPTENISLKCEEDEDEIIKIATQYMLSDHNQKKIKGKAVKHVKKFNLPDNVETGFRTVSSMVQSSEESRKRKCDRTLLDKFLDSDTDDDIMYNFDSQRSITKLDSDNDKDTEINSRSTASKRQKELNFTSRPEDTKCLDQVPEGRLQIACEATKIYEAFETDDIVIKPHVSSKRFKMDQSNSIHRDLHVPTVKAQTEVTNSLEIDKTKICPKSYNFESYESKDAQDEFDELTESDGNSLSDGLDLELEGIVEKIKEAKAHPVMKSQDSIFNFDTEKPYGTLSYRESIDLHKTLYIRLNPIDQIDFYDPINAIKSDSKVFKSRFESKLSKNLISALTTKPDGGALSFNSDEAIVEQQSLTYVLMDF